jgi:hypothetical protein
MQRRAMAGLICCTALLAAPGAAGAAAPIESTLTLDSGVAKGPGLEYLGHLGSAIPKCVAGRTVKLFFSLPGGERLMDTVTSSTRGVFGVGGNATGAAGGRIFVTRKKIGSKRHPKFCGSASTLLA